MKKLLSIIFILTLSTQLFGSIKEKNLVGKWNYVITLSNGQTEGSFIFSKLNGKLEGEAIQADGSIYLLSKIKINKKNNTLCFEIPRENDVAIEINLTVEDQKFKGKGWINEADFDITGKKIRIHK